MKVVSIFDKATVVITLMFCHNVDVPRRVIDTIAIDKKAALPISLWAVALGVIGLFYFNGLLSLYSVREKAPHSANLTLLVFVSIATLIVHELIHGLAYKSFGAKPKFGARLQAGIIPILYASAKGAKLSLPRMLIVGLSPFAAITIITSFFLATVPSLTFYTVIALEINLVGSSADIWLTSRLLRHLGTTGVTIEDTENGFRALI